MKDEIKMNDILETKWKPVVNFCSKVDYNLPLLCENVEQFCKLNDLDFTSSLVSSMSVLCGLSAVGCDIQIVSSPVVLIDDNGTVVMDGGTGLTIETTNEEVFKCKDGAKVYYYHSIACDKCDKISHRMSIVE